MTSGQWDMIAMEALEREALEQYTVQEFPVRAFSPPRQPPPPPLSSSSSMSAATSTNITGGGIIDASPYTGAYLRQPLHNIGGPHHQHHIVQQQQQLSSSPSPLLESTAAAAVPSPHTNHPSHNCPLNPHHQELQRSHPRYTTATATAAAAAAAAVPIVGHCRAEHHHQLQQQHHNLGDGTTTAVAAEHLDEELEDHIKHCTCTCNHMGYGNFMDYQTTCFSGLPDVTEPSNHLQHHHQKFATAAVAAMATPHQLPATIAGEPLLHNYHHHHHTQQHHHLLQQQQHHHHHHPNIGSNHHPPYPGHNKQKAASCREAGGYIVDFMHSCNKAPPSPGRASPSSSMRQLPDDISAKSDTDLSGDKKDFVRRQNSSSGGAGRRFRRRSGHHGGGGSGGDCMGLPCVSCSLCVAILAVLVLLGLAVALSVADVDVVAGWFGGGRGGPKSNELRMRVVRRVLLQTPLIDGHNDLPWNIRRYAHNRLENFSFATGLHNVVPWNSSMWSRTDWPRLRAGLVGAQFWSAYVPCAAQGQDAVQVALEQIDLIHRFIEWNAPRMQFVRSAQDIIDTHRDGRLASLIGVEGGHALGSSLSVLRAMYTLGVRYMTLTYTCDTPWASSSTTEKTTATSATPATDVHPAPTSNTPSPPPRGLSSFGKLVVREMNRLGMMIDLAHSSDATVRDVLAESRAPVIFSHSAARALCNVSRNVNDETLRDIATNGGIVMVSFDAAQVACTGGVMGSSATAARRSGYAVGATISDVIAHINYVRAIAGVGHIGIGAGFDGIATVPAGLEDVSAYPRLFAELLRDPKWTEADLHLLAGQNLLRVLHSVENTRDYMAKLLEAPAETMVPRAAGMCTSKSL